MSSPLHAWVDETRRNVTQNLHLLLPEDQTEASTCIETIEFHLSNGDQTRARIEHLRCLNYLSSLTVASGQATLKHHKEFVKLWAHSLRHIYSLIFPEYDMLFECGVNGVDWEAKIAFSLQGEVLYSLTVTLVDNSVKFVVFAYSESDYKPLYKKTQEQPTVKWMSHHLNGAYAAICRKAAQPT